MRVGRNDPCPCGSGLKFKKCHGAAIPVNEQKRECGSCTACCGEGCCTIYERRRPPAFQQEMLAKLERGERLW